MDQRRALGLPLSLASYNGSSFVFLPSSRPGGDYPHKRLAAHLAIKTSDLRNMFPLRAHRLSATTVVFHSVGATGLAANRLLMS